MYGPCNAGSVASDCMPVSCKRLVIRGQESRESLAIASVSSSEPWSNTSAVSGLVLLGVDWLMPLYCQHVRTTVSSAAARRDGLTRCSFIASGPPATGSSCSSVKLEGSQLCRTKSVMSRSSTRSTASVAILSVKVSRALSG